MDQREFTVGSVLRQTFSLIGRHRSDFAAAAALLVFLPTLLVSALNAAATRSLLAGDLGRQSGSPGFILFSVGAVGGMIVMLLSLLLFGMIISAALGDVRGEPRSLDRDTAASLKLFLPNLVIAALFYVALVIGLMVLVGPGLMLQCAWYVAIPAYMAERAGVFGILLLYGLALGLVGGLNYVVTLSLARNGIDGGAVWAYRIVYAASAAGVNVLDSAAPAVAYIELDRVKGGPLSSDLVEAFG